MVKVLFVCLGNICRSPIAEATFRELLIERGLTDVISCDSAATSTYQIGDLPDRRTRRNAEQHGLTLTHIARQLQKSDFEDFTYIIGMDEHNYEDIMAMGRQYLGQPPQSNQVFLLRKYDPFVDAERIGIPSLPDPYYDHDEAFEEVYQIVKRSNEKLLNWIVETHQL